MKTVSRKKKSKWIVVIMICILVELGSGLIIYFSHKIFNVPKRIAMFRFHPLLTGQNILQYESSWSEKFPVFSYVNRINNSDECGMTTDLYGFIHNGNKDRTIQPDDFTIFIIGGSTVAGHGSSCNDQTISAHLEKLLADKGKNVKVINAGVSGYYSPQELLKVINEILFYDPDIVISLSGTNDFRFDYNPYRNRENTYFVGAYYRSLYATLDDTRTLSWSFRNFLFNIFKFTEHTYTRFLLQKGFSYINGSPHDSGVIANVRKIVHLEKIPETDIVYDDANYQDLLDKKIRFYTYYIKQIDGVLKANKKKYYFVLQPILFTEQRRLPSSEEEALALVRYAFYKRGDGDMVQRAGYFWDKVTDEMNLSGINFYNAVSIFSDDQEVYYDFVHYNDFGNKIIAENLYKMLLSEENFN